MTRYIDDDILSCCNTLVMRGTDVLDFATFGYMDLETRRPLTGNAIYRMYSNTKLVTSVAAMMLWERGRFDLDDDLATHLPAFDNLSVLKPNAESRDDVEPVQGPIRIRHVLSHSAGFSYGFIEPESVIDRTYIAAGLTLGQLDQLTLEEICDLLARQPLCYQPGTEWRYSLATDVMARLVEVWSGQPFDAFLAKHIFDPLGMVDTGFFVPPDKLDRLVTMYAPDNLLDPMAAGMHMADSAADSSYAESPTYLSGGGGLVSTVADYLSFVRMIVAGGTWGGATILKPGTLELMRENQLADGVGVNFPMWSMPGTTFGLGFALKERLRDDEPALSRDEYHWGGMAGTHSWMAPRANLTGMCMTQRMPGFWHPFSHEFKALAYQIAGDAGD